MSFAKRRSNQEFAAGHTIVLQSPLLFLLVFAALGGSVAVLGDPPASRHCMVVG